MTLQQIDNIAQRILVALEKQSYTVALAELETLVEATSSPWELRSKAKQISENYKLMVKFALDGYEDASRREILNNISSGIKKLVTLVKRECQIKESSNLYFSTLRYQQTHKDKSISDLLTDYINLQQRITADAFLSPNPTNDTIKERKTQEQSEENIFSRIWVTFPFSEDDSAALGKFLNSDAVADATKQLIIGALLLGALKFFDERRLELLADTYINQPKRPLGAYAICSLAILLWFWRKETLSSGVKTRIEHIMDTNEGKEHINKLLLQFIRTFDTARITRQLNEELIPKMRNLSPKLEKLKEMQEFDFDSMPEENPQWSELIKESGIEEQLKKLNDMQLDGSDVMMGTFSHLKTFPFFNDVVNWFRPFDTNHSMLHSISEELPANLLEMISLAPMLCDSDKYSMAFSMVNMPADMLSMMKTQLASQDIDIAMAASLENNKNWQDIMNSYMQNLYRFFNLYRRKGDFTNPLAGNINLFDVDILATALSDAEIVGAVGAYYLKYGYYKEALSVFNRLSEEDIFMSNDYLQQIGYCKQKLGDYSGAIDSYSKSELLDGRNKWTLRRLAFCHKALGNAAKALEYFNRLLELQPNDINLTLNAGHAQMELGNYDEAMNLYFKVEFLDENTTKTLRPIAWCALLSGNLERARSYCAKIMESSPTASDYINQGHLLMADNQPRKACEAYAQALSMMDGKIEKLKETVKNDMRQLRHLNIDPLLLQLVIDQVEATLWK